MLICFRLVVLALFYLSIATSSTRETVIFPILKIIVLVVCLMASHFRNTKLAFVEYSILLICTCLLHPSVHVKQVYFLVHT
jgi:hypothetical protein